jgi:hypothetical protein
MVVLCSGRGFSDYKLLIHAATDNPFTFLYHIISPKRFIDRSKIEETLNDY